MDYSASALSIPIKKSDNSLKALQPQPAKRNWKKLAIPSMEEVRFIPFEDILYCKSTNNYTTVFVKGGKSYMCCKILKEIEARLPADQFFRIHQSYLVNLECVTCLKKHTGELEIENKLLLPVSQIKKTALYKLLDA